MSETIKAQIQYLLIQYLNGNCTGTDRDLLARYLIEKPGNVDWEELIEELMLTEPALQNYNPSAWQPVIEDLKSRNRLIHAGEHPGKVVKMRSRVWWAAAAVLLVAASTIIVVSVINRKKENASLTDRDQPIQYDISPGGNKAVLTLASGEKIILDSAANGRITRQGNTEVVKLDNGRLAYNVKGETGEVLYNTMSTPRGGQYRLILPDGTNVWLNASSSITYPAIFVGKDRKVKVSGEVYFEVVRDRQKPFRIDVDGKSSIEVLGTSFNINSYANEANIRTTLLEGSVKVARNNKTVFLKPGQQAEMALTGISNQPLRVVNKVDVDQVVAWKNGFFTFRDAPLTEVMRQLERWYDIQVKYVGDPPTQEFVGELQRNLTLSQVIETLEEIGVQFSIEGRTLIVTAE